MRAEEEREDALALLESNMFQIVRETGFDAPTQASDIAIQKLYGLLVANEKRNDQIVDDVLMAMEEGRSPILLTERKEHLERLHDRLKGFVRHIVFLREGRSHASCVSRHLHIPVQWTICEKAPGSRRGLAAIPDDEERLILATGRYVGEGFDDARLDTLFLALPVSCKGSLVQYAGCIDSTPGNTK